MSGSEQLVGREAQLDSLRRFLDGLPRSGTIKVLLGDPGVGKTRLLDAAGEMARASGFSVLSVAGVEYESDISYSSLQELLSPIIDERTALPEDQRVALEIAVGLRDGPTPNPLLVCNAARGLLLSVSAASPLLLLVDDVPWMDRASAAVAGFIARRLGSTRIGMLAAVRTAEATLFDESRVSAEIIPPLSDASSLRLLMSEHPALTGETRRAVLEQAEGNPLAIIELAHAMDSSGASSMHPTHVLPVSERLERTFAFRIRDLPDRTREALLVLALDGRDSLFPLAGAGFELESLDPAERGRLLTVALSEQRVTFRHPLVRSVVVSQATGSERQHAHRVLAQLASTSPERQAWHLAESAAGPDAHVAASLEEIGRSALARGDLNGATTALRRAAQLMPDPTGRARLQAEIAYLGVEVTGEVDNALDLLSYMQATTGKGMLHAAVAATRLHIASGGDYPTAHHQMGFAIEHGDHGWQAADPELNDALHHWVTVSWLAGRDDLWQSLLDAIHKLEPAPDDMLLGTALSLYDPARFGVRARDLLQPWIDGLDQQHDAAIIAKVNLAATFVDLGPFGRNGSLRIVRAARKGSPSEAYVRSLAHLGVADFAVGRWDELHELADEGYEAASSSTIPLTIWPFFYLRSLSHAVRGRLHEAGEWAERLDAWALSRRCLGAYQYGLHARTIAAEAAADWDAAFRYASSISPPGLFASGAPTALWVAYDLIESALHTGRVVEARLHYEAMTVLDVAAISPRLAMITTASGALVSEAPDWRDMFENAVSAPDAERWPFDLARIRLSYGERLRRARDLARAKEVLHDALRAFERLGAEPWTQRTLSELRAAHDARAVVSHDPAGLTPQEYAIAELAAIGLTNREIASQLFLSPRTVGGYLYRIFPKLGVTTRAALRDALTSSDTEV
ncbi:AAA family ATPase [Leifsonia aquatica]|uniref:ATP-binding protein n=1 Tax=Leifsonia aquatica TaxID=144185 RepID=UPI003850930F